MNVTAIRKIIREFRTNRKEQVMATFLMFGKYNAESVKGISAQRTQKVSEVAKKLGGKVLASYALLGCHDLVFVLDLPDTGKAMKASIELAKTTGIGFTTSPAVAVEEFDRLLA